MKRAKEALVLLLAGGVGSRLNILVQKRAKPAVPFAGIYRIIDFSLSNVMNSGLTKVATNSPAMKFSIWRMGTPGLLFCMTRVLHDYRLHLPGPAGISPCVRV